MLQKILTKAGYLVAAMAGLIPGASFAAFEYNLPEPVAGITQEIYDLHMFAAYVGLPVVA